jgi:curli biogenesis system outer membrane secretion channel CsgG
MAAAGQKSPLDYKKGDSTMKLKGFMDKFFCILGALLVFGCASKPEPVTPAETTPAPVTPATVVAVSDVSSGKVLDTAIEEAAARIDNAFDAGTEIALISVSSPSAQFSEYVLSYLETVLVNNGKLAVVDRANLDKIRAEQGFQLSGDVSDESAKAIGQLLGAGAIVTGSLVNLGDVQRLNIKSINDDQQWQWLA